VIGAAKNWKPHKILVEDKGTGTSLVQELKRHIAGIIAVEPEGDKQARMSVASAKIEAGQVFLPENERWLPDLEAELFAFPGSRHDDQCDSISQALMHEPKYFAISPEILAEAAEPKTAAAFLRRRLRHGF
jgi:predicted phage terminase large subunit-like protein